jgi:hypothetical protein
MKTTTTQTKTARTSKSSKSTKSYIRFTGKRGTFTGKPTTNTKTNAKVTGTKATYTSKPTHGKSIFKKCLIHFDTLKLRNDKKSMSEIRTNLIE